MIVDDESDRWNDDFSLRRARSASTERIDFSTATR